MEVGQQSVQYQYNSEAFDIPQEKRSANYKPNIWKYDFLQSLSSPFDEEKYKIQANKLREEVKQLFVEELDIQAKLELIDHINKFGLASYFRDEIKTNLDVIAFSFKKNDFDSKDNLYITALCFRILRQHGYEVSSDVFNNLMEKKSEVDIKGVIELYEASYLALEGEEILEEAKTNTTKILNNINCESNIYKHVIHILELPSHWRVSWFDVKWQINIYEQDKFRNNTLLQLAKLNYNIIQVTLQNDLKDISRWWKNLDLIENLNFSRDRLVESFLCTVGLVFEPQYSSFRKCLTKVIVMILVIDDVYDIYGSLEQLLHFTNAINSFDAKEIEELPECMKICFLALDGITRETADEIQKGKGWDHAQTQLHLQKVWADFCKALFVEAKWFNKKYTPTLEEYLKNACISSSGSLLSVHSFFSIMNQPTKQTLNFLQSNHDLLHNISLIIRLCNDLGTSAAEQERGDAASSIVCRMQEMNISEDEARNYIKELISKSWKKINGKSFVQSPELQLFVNVNINMARVVHNLYQNRDGFGVQDRQNKKQMLSLLVEPLKFD